MGTMVNLFKVTATLKTHRGEAGREQIDNQTTKGLAREHLLRAGESGKLLVLSVKRASGNVGTASPSSPKVLVSSWGEVGGRGPWANQPDSYGATLSPSSRGIWSSGRKEGPLEGHKGGKPPDPRASGHVEKAELRANKGTFLGRKWRRGLIASFSSHLSLV